MLKKTKIDGLDGHGNLQDSEGDSGVGSQVTLITKDENGRMLLVMSY